MSVPARFHGRALLLVASALLPGCRPEASQAPARRVILITCDTLRADRLGAYGYPRPTSPNVDTFAADATVFEHAWSTAPTTGPALGSMLTSRMPEEIGLTAGNKCLLPPEIVSLPEILAREGIATSAVVSNWVLRRPPADQSDAGIQQGFAHFDDEMRAREANRDFYERSGEETTDAAIAWLSSRRDQRSSPFFLWVHYQDPHGPYSPPARFAELFDAQPAVPEPDLAIGTTQSGLGQIPAYQVFEGERSPHGYRNRYDAEVRTFDEAFGRLLRWLRENGMYEGSLILLAADHGESLGEHGYWFCHGENTWAEALRIPLVVRAPDGRTPGRRSEVASLLDVQPTVLEALGVAPAPGRGLSLLASSLPRDRIVPQIHSRDGDPNRWTAATGERFRVVVERESAPRLYDLSQDPGEARDIAPSNPAQIAELLRRGQDLLSRDVGPPATRTIVRSDLRRGTGTAEALKKLGYTEGEDPH